MGDNKVLNFWEFTEDNFEIINPLEDIDINKINLLKPEEMQQNHEKLKSRINSYKDKPCYGFLKGFYDFYLQASNSSDETTLLINYRNSLSCLELFSQCYEKVLLNKDKQKEINI
jgi:hypothetical protein